MTVVLTCPICVKPTKHYPVFVDNVVGKLLTCLPCFVKPAVQGFFKQKGWT